MCRWSMQPRPFWPVSEKRKYHDPNLIISSSTTLETLRGVAFTANKSQAKGTSLHFSISQIPTSVPFFPQEFRISNSLSSSNETNGPLRALNLILKALFSNDLPLWNEQLVKFKLPIAKPWLTKNARLYTIKLQNLYFYTRLKTATQTDTDIPNVLLRYDGLRSLHN